MAEGVSWAFRGEWKPFPTVHPSGRPKSAGALLGKPIVNKVALSRAIDSKFDAKISGKHISSPRDPDLEITLPTIDPNCPYPFMPMSASPNDLSAALSGETSSPAVSPSHNSELKSANSSRSANPSVFTKQQHLASYSSLSAKATSFTVTDTKTQRYTLQNMSALIHQSLHKGCAFVPKTSSSNKKAAQKRASFATEAENNAEVRASSSHSGGDQSAVSALGKKKSAQNESALKPSSSTSELVASICQLRYQSRLDWCT